MTLIYGRLCESASRSMKHGPLGFPVVPQKGGLFAHHHKVGPFPYDFIFPSILGPFLRADEELGSSREVVDDF